MRKEGIGEEFTTAEIEGPAERRSIFKRKGDSLENIEIIKGWGRERVLDLQPAAKKK